MTVFRMCYKFLHFLEVVTVNDTVGDMIKIDEKYTTVCHKGTKLDEVKPLKHGFKAKK